ncbi:endo-beta-N-acetylglucosaminidase family protein [Streptococcus iniae]|uniref:endo-beta-N-acetylglucosaminidase family protein n=1 Tax=Streptococcus iniae TaxID=1346 RepID=UPI002B30F028|nr:endo-beta-N-acetylglucosaminidase family protein [Streptococcus iniae]
MSARAAILGVAPLSHPTIVEAREELKMPNGLEQSIADVEAKIDALTYLSKNSKDEFKHSMYEIPSNREHKPVSPKQALQNAKKADAQAERLAKMTIPKKEELKALEGPLYGGYFRTWQDKTSDPTETNKVNSFGELPKEVDLAFVFHDYTKDYSLFWEELATKQVPKLNKQGTRVIRTIPWRFLSGADHSDISADKEKFPNTEAGNKALAKAIVDEYVYKYNLDGLDIDIERDSVPKVNDKEDPEALARTVEVFKEIGKLIGANGADKSRLLIMDTTYTAEENPLIKETAQYLNLLLVQVYGFSGENGNYLHHKNILDETSSMEGRWQGYSKYIRPEQYMVGFSFYEEKDFNNRWKDINEEDPSDPHIGEKIQGTRAERYAKWQPKTGGLKGGLFSYAIDRDGVAQPKQKTEHPELDKIVKSEYKVSKALKKLMMTDDQYQPIDQSDFPDKALRESIIKQVGTRRGDLERFKGTLRLDNPEIKDLTGLNKLKRVAKLELINLPKITKIDKDDLPQNLKPLTDNQKSNLEIKGTYDDSKLYKDIPAFDLVISGLSGLESLDISGHQRDTLSGIDASTLPSLKAINISDNHFDLAQGTENRHILDTILATLAKNGASTASFDKQKPKGLYPESYSTAPLHLQVGQGKINVIDDLIFGTRTNQNTLINTENDFEAYKEQTIQGKPFIAPDYLYDNFKVSYKEYSASIVDSTLAETTDKTIDTAKAETYQVTVSNKDGKTVHSVKVIVGDEKPMMVNLAQDAKIIGTDNMTQSAKVFDGQKDQFLLSWNKDSSVIFELKTPGTAKHWRFFDDGKNDSVTLSVFKGDASNFETEKDKAENWVEITKDSRKNDDKVFSSPLEVDNAKYLKVTIKKEAKYIYFNELQILGYPGVVAKKTADDLRPTEADKSDDKSDKNDTEAK